ncbi:glycosyltransferase family 2 protein [Flavobacterium sp. 17A]|uniref:Glycosyltransferase family 2 protein n=1 Tax=Flavobacterium potami TaxID=2872310 RepID=A0A9X1KRK3_9FLAO|nr:glycosyltransferase family 2 protein [Flavobacterium potami]MBZ4036564.1 glycosyltransferase family 2 protein [Flavobacterium potami]
MLAIIIPYYKLTFFEQTLESLQNQTDKRFNVYIGDDASPENPVFLLEKFKEKVDFVYHRFEENLGGTSLVKQWQRCISLSKNEEWIMILGDDDLLSKNVVEEFYSNLPEFENKTDVVRFASKSISEENQKISEKFEHPKWEAALSFYYKRFKGLTRSSLSEHVFTRNSYLKYGFREYPLAWHSDDIAWIDFSQNKPVFAINSSYVIVRHSKINITGKKDNFDSKHKAEQLFFTDLVYEKLDFFKSNQKNEFLMTYEIAIKRYRKLTFKEWKFLFENYLKNAEIVPFLKCIRRFFKDNLAL